MKLTEEQIQAALPRVPEWQVDGKLISRRFGLPSFPAAIAFVNDVAAIAEARNHHPFISIDYKKVTLRLTSWHHGGLTEADFAEAEACDAAYKKASAGDVSSHVIRDPIRDPSRDVSGSSK